MKKLSDKYPYGHYRFYEIMEELKQLHSNKNRDYASKEHPLSNFNRVAELAKTYELVTPGNEPAKVAVIYMLKQVDAALKLLGKNQRGLVEGIEERLKDIAVYSVLLIILLEESEKRGDFSK